MKTTKNIDDAETMPVCCAEEMRYGRSPCCDGITGDEPSPLLDAECSDHMSAAGDIIQEPVTGTGQDIRDDRPASYHSE